MPVLKGEAYHWELLNREGVRRKKKEDMWSALGCLRISSDFIRKKMAEAIPPDNSQLVCVGELCCPKSLRKESESTTLCLCNSSSASQLPQTIPRLACCSTVLWDNTVQQVWHGYCLMNRYGFVLLCMAISWLIADLTWAIMLMTGSLSCIYCIFIRCFSTMCLLLTYL